MGWFGKLAFGSMGMFFGGPLGAIVGAALGHHLIDKKETSVMAPKRLRPQERSQAAYFVSIFSILGKLAKADGVVTRDEISVVNEFISQLNMPEPEKQFARQVFNESKASPYPIDAFAAQFYQMNKHQPTILLSFLHVLFRLAAADGTLHPAEDAILKRMKNIFQIGDATFDNLKSVYFRDTDKYYRILNCTPRSSDQEIRTSYKKLVKDFHPDTIISKGLPEEFAQFATERFREIQAAYEQIRQERKL